MPAKPRKRRSRRYQPSLLTHTAGIRALARPRVEINRGLAWHAIWTAPRAEQRICRRLEEKGLTPYLPTERIERPCRGRLIEHERPAVGRYVFVGLHGARPQFDVVHRALDDLSGVQTLGRLLRSGDVPLRVPASALQRLEDGLTLFDERADRFAAGDAVAVREGPFAAFRGTVERSDDYRVRALLDVFGRRTPVEFDVSQLEAA